MAKDSPGSVWRSGNAEPLNGDGVDGDFYLNTSNGDVYVRASGVYVLQGSIKGDNGFGAVYVKDDEESLEDSLVQSPPSQEEIAFARDTTEDWLCYCGKTHPLSLNRTTTKCPHCKREWQRSNSHIGESGRQLYRWGMKRLS